MPQRLPRSARLAIAGVKLAVASTVATLGVMAPPAPTTASRPVGDTGVRTDRLLEAHSCSTTGFTTEQQPLSAVVRSPSGKLRFVDFDTGWRVFTAHGQATLLAVCLDQPPA